jgi:SSS family solute:Na+ symporter
MTDNPFGPSALAVFGLYLVGMVGLAMAARRAPGQRSLSGFYLADRDLGTLVLLLTFYATQYSGNTLLGFPGEAYRVGFLWVMSVGFMTAIIVVYLLFAPELYRASRERDFVTPGDWLDHRFGLPALSLIANLLFLVVITNFLLAQLMAMGHVVATLSGGAVPFWAGVVGLGLVVVLYETVGGMRAVAWTDCAQGAMLLIGLLGILIVILPGLGGLSDASAWIIAHQPAKASVPGGEAIRTWISTLLLTSLSAVVYPQALQRIFAARSARTLRNSLSVMVFLPMVTVLPMFLVGILSVPRLSGLEGIAADQVMPELLRTWAGQSVWLHAMALLVLTGIIGAIMSTADSVLLSLSAILAKDLLGKAWLRNASSEQLARWGKGLSWAVMLGLMAFALTPRITLWGLIELKLEILVQIAPLFILGTLWPGLGARGALAGMVVGALFAGGMSLGGYGKLWGWHAGLIALVLNLATACVVNAYTTPLARRSARRAAS